MVSAASRPRPAWTLLVVFLSVVAAARPAFPAAVSEDVPVPGGTAALAQALGIETVPDRGRFVAEITRLLYNAPEGRKPSAEAICSPRARPRRATARCSTRGPARWCRFR